MQATLAFRFPRRENDVSVSVYVPLLEQRPRATANFLFMCTGELPSEEVSRALGLSPEHFASPTPPVLKPFADSAVVRIDRSSLLELGSSTTKSIFGGFYPDEPFVPAADRWRGVSAAMQQLRAGTVVLGGLGMPNTNGSRYYVLLHDAASREELGGAARAFGFITSGLEALREACNGAAVHSRTLSPLSPVRLWAAAVRFNTAQGKSTGEKAAAAKSLAGRVRRRDESEEEEVENGNGFFAFSRTFPGPQKGKDGEPQAKRRRVERAVEGEDGSTSLRAMAVMSRDESDVNKPFDPFQAQETVFMDDIETIVARQAEKQQNKKRRIAKAKTARSVSMKKGPQQSSGSTVVQKKSTRRRY